MKNMSHNNTHTTEEAEHAAKGLLDWARENRQTITIAAMLVTGGAEIVGVPHPHGMMAGAFHGLSDTDVVILIIQLEIVLLMMLAQIAAGAEIGEIAFRTLYTTLRKQMFDTAGLTACPECDGLSSVEIQSHDNATHVTECDDQGTHGDRESS